MRAETKDAIVIGIVKHANQYGGWPHDWYVGITEHPTQRLYADHRVDEENNHPIFKQALSVADARAAEKELLSNGCQGDTGGGANPDHVYAYKIASNTSE